jgi:DHA1 family bicyclomycin/chloramphenicol resistance-like MFS transporter
VPPHHSFYGSNIFLTLLSKKTKILPRSWIAFLLIFSLGVVESATDIYIPSMPRLVLDFKTSTEHVGFTISAYFFAFCLMGPVYGPLSDALGRRKVFIAGMFFFTLFSFLCALSTTIESLICFRFLQGLGASVAWILGLSIVKDIYPPQESFKMISVIGAIVAIVPGIAPVMGGYIALFLGWRFIFWTVGFLAFLALLFLVFTFKETLPPEKRQKLDLRVAMKNYWVLLKNDRFLYYASISGLMFSGLMVNVSISPFYYIEHLKISPEKYGYFQMTLVLAYVIGTYINRKAMKHIQVFSLLGMGLLCSLTGASLLFIFAVYCPLWPWLLTGGMAFYSFGAGIAFSNTSNCALEVFPEAGGTSAALLGVIETVLVALGIGLAGLIYVDTFWPIGIFQIVCVGASLLFWKKLKPFQVS